MYLVVTVRSSVRKQDYLKGKEIICIKLLSEEMIRITIQIQNTITEASGGLQFLTECLDLYYINTAISDEFV